MMMRPAQQGARLTLGTAALVLAAAGCGAAPPEQPEQPTIVIVAAPADRPAEPAGAADEDEPAGRKPPILAPEARLERLAERHAAGLSGGGLVASQSLEQGDKLELPLTLEPGRCYTLIAVGSPGITDLLAQLLLQAPPLPEMVAAQENQPGGEAVLGGDGSCFKNPLPVSAPAVGRVTVRSGRGRVWLRIYSQ